MRGWSRALALIAAAAAVIACRPRARAYRVEDLGIPRTERSVQARAVLGDILYAVLFETKGEGRLAVVDLASGQTREVPLTGATGGDAMAVDAAAGRVYVGTSRKAG